jgi:hypothetical protein
MTYAGSRLVPDLEHPIFKQLDLPDPDEGALRLRQVSQLTGLSWPTAGSSTGANGGRRLSTARQR